MTNPRSPFWRMLARRTGIDSPTELSKKMGLKRANTMFTWATGFAYPSWNYCKDIGGACNLDPVEIWLDAARCKIIEIEGEDYFGDNRQI